MKVFKVQREVFPRNLPGIARVWLTEAKVGRRVTAERVLLRLRVDHPDCRIRIEEGK